MKYTLLLAAILLLIGCGPTPEELKAQKAFFDKYGAYEVNVCNEAGFLENRYLSPTAAEKRYIIRNDADQPIRCTDNVTVQVKETAATGLLSGSTN